MNKYKILGIILVVLVAGGIVYDKFVKKTEACGATGQTKSFTITSEKDKWNFLPDSIDVNCGDKVVLTVVNKDSYDHGFALEAFGVSQRMPANGTITIEFTASQTGEFVYYCSVPCGEGVVNGVKRNHFSMVGKMAVK
jgi:cytochrome c oxidase subunit II